MTTDAKTIGSGSLLIAWQLKGRKVAIIGGGEVASQRIESILNTDAQIHVIAPSAGLHPNAVQFIGKHTDRITHLDQKFAFAPTYDPTNLGSVDPLAANVDLFTYDMVLTALDDVDLSRRIVEACRARRIPVNAADIPDLCDFYFGGQVRDGPLQIMISTNGNAPRLSALIKNKIKASLTGYEGEALTKVGTLRNRLKQRAPGIGGDLGKRRMKWTSGICNRWSMEELANLDEETIDWLLDEGWEKNLVLEPPRQDAIVGYISKVGSSFVVHAGLVAVGFMLSRYIINRQT